MELPSIASIVVHPIDCRTVATVFSKSLIGNDLVELVVSVLFESLVKLPCSIWVVGPDFAVTAKAFELCLAIVWMASDLKLIKFTIEEFALLLDADVTAK